MGLSCRLLRFKSWFTDDAGRAERNFSWQGWAPVMCASLLEWTSSVSVWMLYKATTPDFSIFDIARIVCGRVCVMVLCPPVPCVNCSSSMWQVCCCGPGGQAILIDSGGRQVPSSTTFSSNVMLSADIGCWTQTDVYFMLQCLSVSGACLLLLCLV